ncbi:MAG: peptidylprolyl isomerase, partial [Prolixibacteraceae bacterium]|nr:peptidylprolyl isomerase [Prolixibacteraceae bacterium]
MNRILFSLLVVCFSALTATAQPDETLITIGKNKIGKAEFERIYKKNNNNLYNESDKKSPKDYLDLFINFKLKVIEAENLKMDTSKAFINELAGYRKDLAAPYLTDVKFNEQQVKEMYRRMTKEVNADHILFNVKPNATPEEEKTVYEKALKVRKEILAGKDFNEAAAGYSDDPSAKTNKGHLGYFSAFQMVAPFENGAFTTPVGEISQPIRSRFGYHLIKVNDVRENRGEIEVAHIMKMFPQGATNEVRRKLKAEIDSIYQLLQNGANFDELAKTLSDDKRSAAQGGKMPWFSDGRMVPEFADAAFAIKNCGEYTKPIETPFGYHIIKKLDFRPVPSFEKAKADIEKKIKKDPERSVSSKKAFIDKLKKEYRYTEYDKNIEKLKGKSPGDEISRKHLKLFTIDQKNYTVGDFEKF